LPPSVSIVASAIIAFIFSRSEAALLPAASEFNLDLTTLAPHDCRIVRKHDQAQRNHPKTEHRQKTQRTAGDKQSAHCATHCHRLRNGYAAAENVDMPASYGLILFEFRLIIRFIGRFWYIGHSSSFFMKRHADPRCRKPYPICQRFNVQIHRKKRNGPLQKRNPFAIGHFADD